MEAQIALTGNVGNDVEYVSGDGWHLARFRLGSTPRWRKGDEWVNGETTWITVRVSGQTALNVRDSVRKGDPLVIVGRLRTRVWTDEANQRHERLQVDALSLGHDLSRGVSTFVRPERMPSPFTDDDPLVPDDMPAPAAAGEPEEHDDEEALSVAA